MTGRIIVSISGTTLLEEEHKLIAHPLVMGVMLFTRNFQWDNLVLLRQLVADLQQVTIAAGKKEGVIVFVDQEGGHIQRFTRGFTPLPPMATYGKAYDLEPAVGLALAREYGEIMARELQALGIVSLAPVVDLDLGNAVISGLGRAAHADPNICAEIALSFVKGMRQAGMPATAKHFPGHGAKNLGDSHFVTAYDDRSLEELIDHDLLPFIKLIGAKCLAAIMPAHITFTKVDPHNTVGMSKIWLQEILRDQLNFSGLVMSDCLSMAGAGDKSYLEKTKATLDICDIALLCNIPLEEVYAVLTELDLKYMGDQTLQHKLNDLRVVDAGAVEEILSA